MSASQALDIIARQQGRASRTYIYACRLAAYGRTRDIISLASTGNTTSTIKGV